MAQQISDIIDVKKIEGDINKVISDIGRLETIIDEANLNTLKVAIDAKGIETLTEMTAAYKAVSQNAQQYTDVLSTQKPVVEGLNTVNASFGETLSDDALKLALMRKEVQDVTAQLKILTAETNNEIIANESLQQEIAALTLRQTELKVAIQQTTIGIKSEIKEIAAASGSMAEMAQTLGQLKVRYRELSEAERENAEIGGKLNQEITALDLKLKALDGSIGNFHRNVGNYASGFKTVGAELADVREKMRLMVLEGKQGSQEFQDLADRGQTLQKSLTAVQRETKESLFSFEHMQNRIGTMFFRMALHMAVFTVALGAIKWMADLMNRGKDEIKEYDEAMESLNKTVASSAMGDKQKAMEMIAIARDQGTAMNLRLDAVKKLQDMYPNYFANLTKEAILTGDITKATDDLTKALLNKALMEANYKKAQLAAGKYSDLQDLIDNAEARRRNLAGGTLTPVTGQNMALIQQGDKAIAKLKEQQNQYLAEINKYNHLADEFAVKAAGVLVSDPKAKKEKGPNEKGINADLESEKARYQIELGIYKKEYLDKKTGIREVDILYEQELDKKEEDANKNHTQNMLKIVDDWAGKDGELAEKHAARKAEILALQLKVQNALTEDEKKLAQERLKLAEELDKKIEQAAEHAREHMAKMLQLEREGAAAAASAKSSHEATQGITPFLSALGFDGDYKEQQKQLKIKRDAKEQEIKDLEKQRDIESHLAANGGTPNQGKLDKFDQDILKKKNEAQDLEFEQQKAHDEKILEAKKRIGEETIELAKQTAAAIKTIQDNRFAAEQQQLQWEMQSLQLQSKQKIDAINATTGFAITKQNQVALVTAQTTAKENEIQQKQNQLALKKAIADKKAAEMGILLNTALAEIKVIAGAADLGPAGLAIGVAEAAIVAAIGAAQYAAAANAPLPQFFEGGITDTPVISAAEKGWELGETPSGDMLLFDKPGAYKAPIGTEIFNNEESERMIRYAVNSMGSLEVQKFDFKANDWKGENLLEELKEINSNLIYSVMAKQPQKPTVIVINQQNYLQRPTRN